MTTPLAGNGQEAADSDREVLDRLVRIETKLDNVIYLGTDHETRIRKLERALWLATGAAAAAGGTVGAFVRTALAGAG